VYRVAQFMRALLGRVRSDELAVVDEYLTPLQRALFRRQSRYDQRHSLDVFFDLRAQGETNEDLLQAALLHDVGKERLWLGVRVAVVLLEAFYPEGLRWLARRERWGPWRNPFFIHRAHPLRGAILAQAAGCSPTTVALIRRHQEPLAGNPDIDPLAPLLARLQAADRRH